MIPVRGGRYQQILPARNNVQAGMGFSPWNLAVADSAEPAKNKWLRFPGR